MYFHCIELAGTIYTCVDKIKRNWINKIASLLFFFFAYFKLTVTITIDRFSILLSLYIYVRGGMGGVRTCSQLPTVCK